MKLNRISLSLILMFCMVLAAMPFITGCGEDDANTPSNTAVESGKLTDVVTAVKAAYGENYFPSMPYDAEMVKELLGIAPELYTEIYAEGPALSFQIDTFIGAEAAEGKADELEAAINAYRDVLVADTFQYPANQLKIQASKVYRVDNYVFFVMLGTISEEAMQGEEGAVIALWEEQNVIAKDAIESTLGASVQ